MNRVLIYILWNTMNHVVVTEKTKRWNKKQSLWLRSLHMMLSQHVFHRDCISVSMEKYLTCYSVKILPIVRITGIILGIGSANERRRYIVTSPIISWASTQNYPWIIIPVHVICNGRLVMQTTNILLIMDAFPISRWLFVALWYVYIFLITESSSTLISARRHQAIIETIFILSPTDPP